MEDETGEFDTEMAAPVPKIKNAKRPLGWRQILFECEWKHGESAVVKNREGRQQGASRWSAKRIRPYAGKNQNLPKKRMMSRLTNRGGWLSRQFSQLGANVQPEAERPEQQEPE